MAQRLLTIVAGAMAVIVLGVLAVGFVRRVQTPDPNAEM
jgi:hypothetical protein